MNSAARKNPLHSQASCEHGSPAWGVELGRHALGSLDVDPMSSAYWNEHCVRAARFFDRRIDGLEQPWRGNVWINPPGADDDAASPNLIRPCWQKLLLHWRRGDISGACWWGYSLEQLQQLQEYDWHPLRCITLITGVRPHHMLRIGSGPPVENTSPSHSGYLTLLTSRRSPSLARQQAERFLARGCEYGTIVRPC